MDFKLHSEFQPTGDQPQAIKELVDGFKKGNQFQTLLGVTGSGKTFTMANVIEQLNKPTLVLGGMLLIAAAAWLTSQGVGILEKKLCPWKRSIDNV